MSEERGKKFAFRQAYTLIRGLGIVAACGGLASGALTQTQPAHPQENLFEAVRPEILLVARQHQMGPQLVEVSAVSRTYPPDLLREQVERLGVELDSDLRGLVVFESNLDLNSQDLTFLKASFAVDNLVSSKGTVNFDAIHRAFAAAPEPHQVEGLTIVIEGPFSISGAQKSISTKKYMVQGKIQRDPLQLEYRMKITDQNPSQIAVSTTNPVTESQKGRGGYWNPFGPVIALVILTGLIVGALVYFVLSRRLEKPTLNG